MAKYLQLRRRREVKVGMESGRLNSERNSGQGRWPERKVVRFWKDREMAPEKEMGMVV